MKSQEEGFGRQKTAKIGKRPRGGLTSEERHRLICEAAYQRALADEEPMTDSPDTEQEIEERQTRSG